MAEIIDHLAAARERNNSKPKTDPDPAPNNPKPVTGQPTNDVPNFARDLVLSLMGKDRSEAEETAYGKFLASYLTKVVRKL